MKIGDKFKLKLGIFSSNEYMLTSHPKSYEDSDGRYAFLVNLETGGCFCYKPVPVKDTLNITREEAELIFKDSFSQVECFFAITKEQALKALEDLDDYSKMETSIKPIGAYNCLKKFIEESSPKN